MILVQYKMHVNASANLMLLVAWPSCASLQVGRESGHKRYCACDAGGAIVVYLATALTIYRGGRLFTSCVSNETLEPQYIDKRQVMETII